MQAKTRGGVGETYLSVGPAGLHYKKNKRFEFRADTKNSSYDIS